METRKKVSGRGGIITAVATRIAKTDFPNAIVNAVGPACTTPQELDSLAKSASGAVFTKSTSPKPREGNPEPRYWDHEWGSINSMGLPNPGHDQMAAQIRDLKQKTQKPVVAGIVGFSAQDFSDVIRTQDAAGADMVEINLSCPNVVGKPQIGYDFAASREYLERAKDATKKPVCVKLPPYLDLVHQQAMADLLKETKVECAVLVNSFGNGLIIDPKTDGPVIRPKGGLGGIGGKYLKPVALGNVRSFYKLLGDKVDIVGVGGVYTGQDAYEHILCGARAVGVASAYAREGPEAFARITSELEAVMREKGHSSVEDFRGKLKEME